MEQLDKVRRALSERGKALAVAKATGLPVSTVYRLRDPSVNPSLKTLLTVSAHLDRQTKTTRGGVMADDGKRGETVCLKITERMALDLLRLAASDDRSMSDFLYKMVRQRLYGDVARLETAVQITTSDDVIRGRGDAQ